MTLSRESSCDLESCHLSFEFWWDPKFLLTKSGSSEVSVLCGSLAVFNSVIWDGLEQLKASLSAVTVCRWE